MKKRILFVDDDKNIIDGLRRMTRVMRDHWDMFFAEGGEEALRILTENNVDVVVSDMRMPGMSGVELLTIVMERYPDIIRVILSGHSDQEMILQAVKCAHQYLLKPCTLDSLSNTIERSFPIRSLLTDETLVKLVTGVKNIPSLPSLYARLQEEIHSENASLKKIGDIIAQDIAMSAKILKIVNSAFFSLPQKISNPHQATIFLGLEIIKTLVIQVELFSVFKSRSRKNRVFLDEWWKHSMSTGHLAREISGMVSTEKKVQEEAFISGMFHDIGKLLLLDNPEYLSKAHELAKNENCSWWEAEYQLFGCSHAEVGGYLLSLWGFSDSVIEAVAFHHKPMKSSKTCFSPLFAVHIANALNRQEDTCDFPPEGTDHNYIKLIGMADRLTEWAAGRDKTKEVDSLYE